MLAIERGADPHHFSGSYCMEGAEFDFEINTCTIISASGPFWDTCCAGRFTMTKSAALFFCTLVQSLRSQHQQSQLG
jgi:hypothetical protein